MIKRYIYSEIFHIKPNCRRECSTWRERIWKIYRHNVQTNKNWDSRSPPI